jgi:ribosome assembly protein 4
LPTVCSHAQDHTLFLWNPLSSKKPITRITGISNCILHVDTDVIMQATSRRFSTPSSRPTAASLPAHPSTSRPKCGTGGMESWSIFAFIAQSDTSRFIGTARAHVGPVYRLTWSGDSRLLITASEDSTIKLWDAKVHMLSSSEFPHYSHRTAR